MDKFDLNEQYAKILDVDSVTLNEIAQEYLDSNAERFSPAIPQIKEQLPLLKAFKKFADKLQDQTLYGGIMLHPTQTQKNDFNKGKIPFIQSVLITYAMLLDNPFILFKGMQYYFEQGKFAKKFRKYCTDPKIKGVQHKVVNSTDFLDFKTSTTRTESKDTETDKRIEMILAMDLRKGIRTCKSQIADCKLFNTKLSILKRYELLLIKLDKKVTKLGQKLVKEMTDNSKKKATKKATKKVVTDTKTTTIDEIANKAINL